MIDYQATSAEKLSVKYDTFYTSSSVSPQQAAMGTIEKDASRHFGDHAKEKFRGKRIFDILISKSFDTVLDVGAGKLEATSEFIKFKKLTDICDFKDSWYLSSSTFDRSKIRNFFQGDINELEIPFTYDALWASHILEHQLNPNIFLRKLFSLLKEGGYLALVVPPRKPFIVGGHVNLWNGGLLLYHLILAGFDCSNAQLLQYDYNIGIVVQKKSISEFPHINYDIGDLHKLAPFFPFPITEGFNGDLMRINIDQ